MNPSAGGGNGFPPHGSSGPEPCPLCPKSSQNIICFLHFWNTGTYDVRLNINGHTQMATTGSRTPAPPTPEVGRSPFGARSPAGGSPANGGPPFFSTPSPRAARPYVPTPYPRMAANDSGFSDNTLWRRGRYFPSSMFSTPSTIVPADSNHSSSSPTYGCPAGCADCFDLLFRPGN